MITAAMSRRAEELAAEGVPFVTATVVRAQRPTSVQAGNVALVLADGGIEGFVGGVCTEHSIRAYSIEAMETGEAILLRILPFTEEAGAAPADFTDADGSVTVQNPCLSGGAVEVFLEPVLPAARLLIFGSSPAARVLSRIANAMGYRVDVVDPDADEGAFPDAKLRRSADADALPAGAHVLVATMGDRDIEAIELALSRSPAYVGVIASAKRYALLRDALLAKGVSRSALDTVAAPAGLDIGARSPEEIAVSVMAQIVERRRAAHGQVAQAKEPPREAVDPVCGMTVAVTGAPHRQEVLGVSYYFCCAGCKSTFLADPKRYLPKAVVS